LEGLRLRDDITSSWQSLTTAPQGLVQAANASGVTPPDAGAHPYAPGDPAWQPWCDFCRRWSASNLAAQVLFATDVPYSDNAINSRQPGLSREIQVDVQQNEQSIGEDIVDASFRQTYDRANAYDAYLVQPPEQAPVLLANLDGEGHQVNDGGDLVSGK